jgi:hypothetical protein
MVSIAAVFHIMGLSSIGGLFTGIALIYGSLVGYLSINKLSDRFFFMNIYILTFSLPGSVQIAYQMGIVFPLNVTVWLTAYFAGGLIVWLFFVWRRLEREILLFFIIFLLSLSVVNFFSWFNLDSSCSYLETVTLSFRLFFGSIVNLCLQPEFIFRTEDINVQVFVAPFIFLFVFLFVLLRKL